MADNAAAAILGQTLSVDASPTSSSLEDDSIEDFLVGGVAFQPGLNFVDGLVIEPRLLPDRHWGRLYNALYHDQNLLGVGIDVDTALELTETGAVVHGDRAVVTLDGRYGKFAKGSNGAVGARYVLLDSFIDGDSVAP
jgi:cyanophycinase-like exopeptidase